MLQRRHGQGQLAARTGVDDRPRADSDRSRGPPFEALAIGEAMIKEFKKKYNLK